MNINKEKQNAIIDTALKEFNEYGFDNASTNKIVNTLGISKGSLFKYFATKKDLYSYLTEYSSNKLIAFIDNAKIPKGHWKEVIIAYADVEFDYLIAFPEEYRFFYNLVNEIEKASMSDIKDYLVRKSKKYYLKIINDAGLNAENDAILIVHIGYVLRGYNNDFIKAMKENLSYELKDEYISGIKTHINLIGEKHE